MRQARAVTGERGYPRTVGATLTWRPARPLGRCPLRVRLPVAPFAERGKGTSTASVRVATVTPGAPSCTPWVVVGKASTAGGGDEPLAPSCTAGGSRGSGRQRNDRVMPVGGTEVTGKGRSARSTGRSRSLAASLARIFVRQRLERTEGPRFDSSCGHWGKGRGLGLPRRRRGN